MSGPIWEHFPGVLWILADWFCKWLVRKQPTVLLSLTELLYSHWKLQGCHFIWMSVLLLLCFSVRTILGKCKPPKFLSTTSERPACSTALQFLSTSEWIPWVPFCWVSWVSLDALCESLSCKAYSDLFPCCKSFSSTLRSEFWMLTCVWLALVFIRLTPFALVVGATELLT